MRKKRAMSSSNPDLERGTESNTNSPRANEAICGPTIYFTAGGKRTPWSIPMFILANFAAFAAAMYINEVMVTRHWRLQDWTKMGAVERYKVVYRNQGWRLIAAMWLHANIVHILLNNLILAVFSFEIEQRFGFSTRSLFFCFSTVQAGTIYLLSLLFSQDGMAVGASRAIYGVIGAMVFELITNWTLHASKGAGLFIPIGTAALGLGLGAFTSHVDNFSHIGRLSTGFLLGFVLLVRPQHGWVNSQDRSDNAHANKPKYNRYQYMLWLLGLALLIIGFAVGLVMLYRSSRTIIAVDAII